MFYKIMSWHKGQKPWAFMYWVVVEVLVVFAVDIWLKLATEPENCLVVWYWGAPPEYTPAAANI
jgi:hypothetical protein